MHDRGGNPIAVVAFCGEACGSLDRQFGIASGTGNACQAHHVQVIVAISTTKKFVRRAPNHREKQPESNGLVNTFGHDLKEEALAAKGIETVLELLLDSPLQVPKLAGRTSDDTFVLRVGDGSREILNLNQRHLVGTGNISRPIVGRSLHDNVISLIAMNAEIVMYGMCKFRNDAERDGLLTNSPCCGTIPDEAPVESNNIAMMLIQFQLPGIRKDAAQRTSTGKDDGQSTPLCFNEYLLGIRRNGLGRSQQRTVKVSSEETKSQRFHILTF